MASFVSRGINWLRRLSDLSHHSIVLGASAASVPVIQTLPPAYNTALCLTAVATQLGAQVKKLKLFRWVVQFIEQETFTLFSRSTRDPLVL